MIRGSFFYVAYSYLFILSIPMICIAKKINLCEPLPSCGDFQNIPYPFGLRGDSRKCGEPRYQLSCEKNRTLVLEYNSVKHHVKAINPNERTIRIADAGLLENNCSSLPSYSSTLYSLDKAYSFHYYIQNSLVFVNCDYPAANSSAYIDTSPCINGTLFSSMKWYSYVVPGELPLSELGNSCSIDMTVVSAQTVYCKGNCSYMDVYSSLLYGFELSWSAIYCEECNGTHPCRYNGNTTEILGCLSYPCGVLCQLMNVLYVIREAGTYGSWYHLEEYLVHRVRIFYYDDHADLAIGILYTIVFVTAEIVVLKFIIGMPCVVAFLIYKWRRRHLSMYDTIEDYLQSQNNLMPIKYSFSNIKKITKGFKDKLGEGGYGSVYKGKLRSGSEVAVKVLGKSKSNGQEFINEVATIGRIHHFNVVRLIGFCVERNKRALVYEFMPNGSLEKYLFSEEEKGSLSCEQMYNISLGIARGVEYLHRGCDMQILHFDIKPHNILLDENFNPKVSDFGLAKLYPTENSIVSLTAARGTMGYMAPELFYKNIGGITYKADVYSFGMLLMEMASRRKNLNTNVENISQIYFPSWVYDQFSEGKDIEMAEATSEEIKVAKKMIIVALWCIQMKPSDRPSMNKAIAMLEDEVENLQMPPKPFLTPHEKSKEEAEINQNQTESPTPATDFSESASLLKNSN